MGTIHVGQYMRSRYTFHSFLQILSLFRTDFVAILYLFCRQLGVRRCFVLILLLFYTTFVAKLELSLIHKKDLDPFFRPSFQACQDGHGRCVPASHEGVPGSRPTGTSLIFFFFVPLFSALPARP